MDIQIETSYTIKLSQKEFDLFYNGLSAVSKNSLVQAGMVTEESLFFCKIFHELHESIKEEM